ncbi:enoyl-CoA hydratase/carnithine racemase [Mycobacterium sp. URHB0021]|jgi:hypothetical protein
MNGDAGGQLRVELEGPLARVVLDRTRKRNALSTYMPARSLEMTVSPASLRGTISTSVSVGSRFY